MDNNILITRSSNLLEARVDTELFALDVDGGHCFSFNATATEIWSALETPMTLDALCDALMQAHDVDRETCVADTLVLIEKLRDENLIKLTPQ
jgi:Coenzyme PQQ synthesis protein D (PqqD)